ncbi:hypothetical protein D3C77_742900 [compost metagenome]
MFGGGLRVGDVQCAGVVGLAHDAFHLVEDALRPGGVKKLDELGVGLGQAEHQAMHGQ